MTKKISSTIVHIITQLDLGGAESLLFTFIMTAKTRRPDIAHAVICLRPDGFFIEKFRQAGIPCSVVDAGKLWENNIFCFPKLRKAVLSYNPTIVQSHCRKSQLWYIPLLRLFAGRNRRIAFLHVLHDTYTYPNPLQRAVHSLLENITLALSHRFIAITHGVKKHHVAAFHLPSGKIDVVHNGIDLTRFPQKTDPLYKKEVATIANLRIKKKGYEVALESFATLCANHHDLRWHIAGEGPLEPYMRAFIAQRGLEKQIIMHGSVTDIPAFLSDKDIFVLPSLWEGFGLVLVEAMATGIPIVASDVDGIPEVLDNSECGVLVPPGNYAALANAINDLLCDPERQKKLIEKGLIRARHFSIEAMVDTYCRIYDQCRST